MAPPSKPFLGGHTSPSSATGQSAWSSSLRRLAAAVVVGNLLLVFAALRHTSREAGYWREVDSRLNATAYAEQALLQRIDSLSANLTESLARMTSATASAAVATTTVAADSGNGGGSNNAAAAAAGLVGDIVVRVSHRGPRKVCSYTESELHTILSMPHKCGWHNNRYFYAGLWLTYKQLFAEFEQDGPNVKEHGENEPECVLACRYQEEYHCSPTVPCLHAFYIRRKTSDSRVLQQVYEWKEHAFLKPRYRIRSILDGGANIGLASVMFATMYPRAKVISVEASSSNFKIMAMNIAPYPNIIPVNAALWPRVTDLALIKGPRNPDLPPEWGYMVVESNKVPKEAVIETLLGVSPRFLLAIFNLGSFDFVKIDIEGGEGELFGSKSPHETAWVDNSKLMSIELHGDMAPGSNVTVHNFFEARPQFEKMEDMRLLEDFVIVKRKGLVL